MRAARFTARLIGVFLRDTALVVDRISAWPRGKTEPYDSIHATPSASRFTPDDAPRVSISMATMENHYLIVRLISFLKAIRMPELRLDDSSDLRLPVEICVDVRCTSA